MEIALPNNLTSPLLEMQRILQILTLLEFNKYVKMWINCFWIKMCLQNNRGERIKKHFLRGCCFKKKKTKELDINYLSKSSVKHTEEILFHNNFLQMLYFYNESEILFEYKAEIQTKIKHAAISFQIIRGYIPRPT